MTRADADNRPELEADIARMVADLELAAERSDSAVAEAFIELGLGLAENGVSIALGPVLDGLERLRRKRLLTPH